LPGLKLERFRRSRLGPTSVNKGIICGSVRLQIHEHEWAAVYRSDGKKAAEAPGEKEEYLVKRILVCAVFVMFLGAAPLLAKSVEGNEYGKGKTVYRNKCQFCHGLRGDGKGPAAEPLLGHPVDFTNSRFWQDDVKKKIEDTIKKGKEMMPAFDLVPDKIKAIFWYMSHTFKKATQNNN
jgi:cytochrome c5